MTALPDDLTQTPERGWTRGAAVGKQVALGPYAREVALFPLVFAAAMVPAAPQPTPPILTRPIPALPPPVITPAPFSYAPSPAPELFERAVKPKALQPLMRLVSVNDYPASALRLGQEGFVEAALTIGADGRVTGCSILRSSGVAVLDYTTCRIMQSRARFEPARDASGAAVVSADRVRLRWALPQQSRIAVAPWHSLVTWTFGADNQVSGCTEERSSLAPVVSNNCETKGTLQVARLLAWRQRKDQEDVAIRSFSRMVPPWAEASAPLPEGERLGDIAAELEIGADGSLVNCTLVRALMPGPTTSPPDCRRMFRGPYQLADRPAGTMDWPVRTRVEILLLKGR